MIRCQSAVSKSSSGRRTVMPLLLITMSSGPTRRSTSLTPASTAASSLTSNAQVSARMPSAASAPAARARLAASRPLSTTRAPALPSARASARPMPRLEPVTRAMRPVRSNSGCAAGIGGCGAGSPRALT